MPTLPALSQAHNAVSYLSPDATHGSIEDESREAFFNGLLGYLPGSSPNRSVAADVSSDGSVVVGYSNAANGTYEAYRWSEHSGMVGLGGLLGGDVSSEATGISADGGVIVGTSRSELGPEAFRWTASMGMVGLGDLPGGFFNSGATAISSDGSTIVGVGASELSDGNLEAFRWTETYGMEPLGDLPGGYFSSEAVGVSFDGSVIVGTSEREDGGKAFVWDESHGMRDLQDVLVDEFGLGPLLADWRLVIATGISDDGLSIVGHGFNANGNREAWLVRLDRPLTAPEPSTVVLLLLFAIGAANLRLAKRGRAQLRRARL